MMNRWIQIVLIFSLASMLSCREKLDGLNTRSDYFVKFIGDSFDQEGSQVIEASDGSLFLVGTNTPVEAESEIYLAKTRDNGEVIWSKTFGVDNRNCLGASLQFTADGGLIILGTSVEKEGLESKLLLIKTSIEGKEEWRETHKVPAANVLDYANYIHVLQDGTGFLLLGYSADLGGNSDIIWVKTTIDGKVENDQASWYKSKDGTGFNEATKVIEWNNSYVIVGSSTEIPNSNIAQSGVNAIAFLAYPNSGVGEFRTFGGTKGDDFGYDITKLPNGNFVLVGSTISHATNGGRDAFLVQLGTDPISNPVDGRYYTFGENTDDWGYSLVANSDNTLTVCGKGDYGEGRGEQMIIFRTNIDFTQAWFKSFGSKSDESAVSLVVATDGGFVTAGTAEIDENKMIGLIKATSNGELK